MTETFCVGIALAHKNHPYARWNRVAARLRWHGAVQIGGLFEFEDVHPFDIEALLHDSLDPGDRFVIRVVLPEAFHPGEQRVA